MTIRTNAIKINVDIIVTIVVAIIIIVYIGIRLFQEFDFSNIKNSLKSISSSISYTEVYDYLDNHPEYYYKIEGSVYCLTKEELINSNEISEKFINNMNNNYIEATYTNNMFNLKYSDECMER